MDASLRWHDGPLTNHFPMAPHEGYRLRVTSHESRLGKRTLNLLPLLAVMVVLASCVPKQRPPEPQPQPPPAAEAKPPTAAELGIAPGPALPALDEAAARRALDAFRISCPALVKRTDASGLTRPADWQEACAVATLGRVASASAFFAEHFEMVQVGDGAAFATGYYEPEIPGSRTLQPGYEVPVYRKPPDLVEVDAATAEAAGTLRRGRFENGAIIPYFERSEIEDGALAGRGLEIAWAADSIDLFFLQIQGSGRLRLPDGEVMRIGYAGQNGRDYVGIGKLMKDRGLLEPGRTTMQDLVAWLRAHPEEGKAIMRENKSYVFFQELTGAGPLGALNLPVTPRATVAADPKFVPLGAPVILDLDRAEADGLWIAQDTGGAIRGSNRFDTFWGAGAEAARIAGGMTGRGRAWLLLPRGTFARLDATPRP
jgi:membrane-bound lytic murein transglycosylase A